MKSFVVLRTGAIIAFLYALGHTMGMPWVPDESPETLAIVQSMAAHRFDAMGAQRSMQDFYFGFGISITVFLLAQAVVLWLIAGQARLDAMRMRPFIAVFLLAFVANAVIAGVYFFVVPCVMASVIALCLLLAWMTAKRPVS